MIAAALRGALSDRAREGRVHVVSDLVGSDRPSTKAVLTALSAATSSAKVLVVLGRDEDVAWVSLRNVTSVHVIAVDQLNAYDVLVNDEIVFTTTALEAFVAGPVAGKAVKAVATSSEAEVEIDALVEPTTEELAAEADGVEPVAVQSSTDEEDSK
jgi:large subunit ribosomal protein L4